MKLIIAGSRTITDRSAVADAVGASPWRLESAPIDWSFIVDEVVHGGADGVDTIAGEMASHSDVDVTVFEPDYDAYSGQAAPIIRNEEMAEYGDALLAVWDGKSSGTRNMIEQALDRGLETYVYVVD